jgi:hypothetical protein
MQFKRIDMLIRHPRTWEFIVLLDVAAFHIPTGAGEVRQRDVL